MKCIVRFYQLNSDRQYKLENIKIKEGFMIILIK